MAEEGDSMSKTIISGARIFDATGAAASEGDVVVENGRIAAVSRKPGQISRAGCEVIDAKGLFLMPGMTDGHSHLSFEGVTQPDDLVRPSPEEHTLLTARVAKKLLDQGFTSAYGASEAKLKLGVVVRNEVNAGRLPGPRIRAGSMEISVTGGMGDESSQHYPRQGASIIVDGPDEMRKAVRLSCREGCDNIKLDVSGDPFYPNAPASSTPMSLEEIRVAVETAHSFGRKVNAHTRSIDGTKKCLEAGVDVLFHVEYTDEETLDMLEAAKDRIFVSPSVGMLHTMLYEAAGCGVTQEIATAMGIAELLEASVKTHTELRKRGIRHLIGGDYGLAFNPNGTNARDLKHFADYYGYSAEGALLCATRNGGLVMRDSRDLGTIVAGSLADLLLVNGDPIQDITIMTDADRLVLIMKGGEVYKNTCSSMLARTQRNARASTAALAASASNAS
jgi:imidazolonepropionase-like amidohydrolase